MNAQDIARKVRLLREAHEMTHAELATLSGIPGASQISKIETGRNACSTVDMRSRLAKGFGLTLTEIMEYLDGSSMTPQRARDLGRPRIAAKLRELREKVSMARQDDLEIAIANMGGAMAVGPVVHVVREIASSGVSHTPEDWEHVIKHFQGVVQKHISSAATPRSKTGGSR